MECSAGQMVKWIKQVGNEAYIMRQMDGWQVEMFRVLAVKMATKFRQVKMFNGWQVGGQSKMFKRWCGKIEEGKVKHNAIATHTLLVTRLD